MCSLDGRSETSTGAIPGERTRASLGEVYEDRLDDLLCSRNARSRAPLAERAPSEGPRPTAASRFSPNKRIARRLNEELGKKYDSQFRVVFEAIRNLMTYRRFMGPVWFGCNSSEVIHRIPPVPTGT
jgi:hypothetical protein